MPKILGLSLCLLLSFSPLSFSLSASFPKDDSVITAQIEAKIAHNPALAALNITVETKTAIVTLTGTVAKSEELQVLVQLALEVAGVNGVDVSHMQTLKGEFNKDDLLTAEIRGLLVREGVVDLSNFAATNINVQTQGGVVTLSGTVASENLANQAQDLAAGTPGVVSVISQLVIAK